MPVKWENRRQFDKVCSSCCKPFKTKKKSSRFCSNSCGQKNRDPQKRQEATQKALQTWKNKSITPGINSILELSSRTVGKIMRRMNLVCSNCGWDKSICDIHHINGRKIKNADNHKNLSYLCPNCHRLVHEDILSKDKLINLKDYIGEKWREHYFGRR